MNWRHKIELNAVLAKTSEDFDLERVEEDCPEEVKKLLSEEVKKAWPLARFAPKIMNAKSIAEVNRILENVYNEADRRAVWCGS